MLKPLEALFIPAYFNPIYSLQIRYEIPAFQIVPRTDGGAQFGPVVKLGTGVTVDVCGDGFDDRTLKVHCNGSFYFVFRQDLERQPSRVEPQKAAASGGLPQ